MGRKRMPGLTLRGKIWQINKKINGQRIYESTGTSCLEEAERYLVHRLEEIRQAAIYGVRIKRIFREAAIRFVEENDHKASLFSDVIRIKQLDPYIGKSSLESIHMGSLQKFIKDRQQDGAKARTINHALQVTRRILNLSATEWLDENGKTWLASAPKIKLLPELDRREPYPISWEEQNKLFTLLPLHLKRMALFAVNTGCRDAEICNLQWDWEIPVPSLDCSVFIIPAEKVKNRENRLVVLNKIAQSVIEEVRNNHDKYVFTYRNKPIQRILNNGWKIARKKANLPHVRVHDLKHTYGRRLRAAGVGLEDRQDLLGHKSNRITTHYSAAELSNLLEASNKVCDGESGVILSLLKRDRVKVA